MKPNQPFQDNDVYAVEASTDADLKAATASNPALLSLPVSVVVSIGEVRVTIDRLLSLNPDTILTLNTAIDDPVELLIGDRVVARGALVETEGEPPGIGVRIVDILDGRKQ
jgi:flagellar motor switch protein FliN/FliY